MKKTRKRKRSVSKEAGEAAKWLGRDAERTRNAWRRFWRSWTRRIGGDVRIEARTSVHVPKDIEISS